MLKTKKARCGQSGIYIGEKGGVFNATLRIFGADRSVVVPNDYSGPMAVIGASGCGKTQCTVLPTLCRTYQNGNFFAIDLKGDLLSNYIQSNPGKSVKVFSLRGESEYSYEPFEYIHESGEADLVSNMRELANALLPIPTNSKDSFWISSAREYLTGGLLYYYDLRSNFIDTIINIMTTPPTELLTKIGKCKNPLIRSFVNNFLGDTDLSDSKLLMGICQEVTNRLSVIANDPRVRKALSPGKNRIQWTDLETCNIFLSVPEDRLDQYSSIIAMMITQLIRSLERRHEKHSSKGANQRRVMVMLDEFPRLGKLDVIASAVSTLRSKDVTLCLVFQSLAQLDAVYGGDVRKIVLDNCSYLAVLNVNDVESQKYFAERAGTDLVERRSRSTNYVTKGEGANPAASVYREVSGYSKQISETREYAIQPHEFATLKDIVFFTPNGYTQVKKSPYHQTDTVTKIRKGIEKVINKVSEVTRNVINKSAVFLSSFFGKKKHSIWI